MTKLQRVIIIIAAFGIVSLVLTQTQTSAHFSVSSATNAELPSVASTPVFTQTSASNDAALSNNTPARTVLQAETIYQTERGSFYFITSNAADNAADNTAENAADKEADNAAYADKHTQPSSTEQPQYEASTLLSTQADIRITGPIARTRLTQVFKNTSDQLRSGLYVFPLPADAAVDHLLMRVGERNIEGKIKRKEVVKALFTQAKAEGKKASLVAQIRPNIFSNHIANIPPHSEISVTIEYQQLIQQDKHNYALRLPLGITPRYSPASDTQGIHHINNAVSNTEKLKTLSLNRALSAANSLENKAAQPSTSIRVSLNTGMPLKNIISEHHPITVLNPYDTEYQIELSKAATHALPRYSSSDLSQSEAAETQALISKDFVLKWSMRPGYSVQASHFNYQANEYEYGLITLLPPSADALAAKRNLVFILDVSGSMVGDSLEQAKQSLAIAIDDLQEDDFFNVIAFSSDATRLWSHSESASENAKDEALTFIYGLQANGGTEIKTALEMAFALPPITEKASTYLNQILFITDGSVSNEDELMQLIDQQLGEYRLFTVGIGGAPNGHFMREAANAGKGTFTFIGDTSTVKPKMTRLLEKLKKPALTDLQLNIKDAREAFGFEIYPSHLPDLYADEPLVISYRRHTKDSHTGSEIPFSIKGQTLAPTASGHLQTRPWSSQLPILDAIKEQGIHKYWARLKIKDLSRQLARRTPHGESLENVQDTLKEAITQVALDHHLVSKFTSLVAIDHDLRQLSANRANKNSSIREYAQAQLPSTATSSGLFMLIGSFLIAISIIILKQSVIRRATGNVSLASLLNTRNSKTQRTQE